MTDDKPQERKAPAWTGVLDSKGEDPPLPVEELEDPVRLRSVVQSLLLVADGPLSPAQLTELLGIDTDWTVVRDVLLGWQQELEREDAGIRLDKVGGGYRLRTATASAPWVRAMTGRRPVRLSRAALETMAIVAYRQPITRSDVDNVRGVDSSVVLRSLLEKDLVRILGRKEEPGRPMIYGTTRKFLEVFGLEGIKELPSLKEFTELAVTEQEELFKDDPSLEEPPVPDEVAGDQDDNPAE